MTGKGEMAANSRVKRERVSGPAEQLNPMAAGLNGAKTARIASGVWPERILPEASLMVSEITTGISVSSLSIDLAAPSKAAFTLRMSNAVSIRRKSAPPSISPRAWRA